jgi:hypothetical protein
MYILIRAPRVPLRTEVIRSRWLVGWYVVCGREGEAIHHSYQLMLSPSIRVVIEAFPKWRQTPFDLESNVSDL